MRTPAQLPTSVLNRGVRRRVFALTLVCALVVVTVLSAQAQTFSVIHTFTGGGDGAIPGGLILDRAGNLYGATATGGFNGAGTVFRMSHATSGWLLHPLLQFDPFSGGGGPDGGLVFGPDGSLYGAVGTENGFGAIFELQPPASPCESAICYWTETILYPFAAGPDGHQPNGNLVFDAAGNLYGTTETGGAFGFGSVFKLTHSGGGWAETVVYNFMGGNDGVQPQDGVVMDGAGNFFGTTRFGGSSNCNGGCGTVFELTPSGGGWTERVIYRFQGTPDGAEPWVGLNRDAAGNLYGTNTRGGANDGGTVFELSPAGDSWNYSVLYSIFGNSGDPRSRPAIDAAGNLYGTFIFPPTLFKLSPSGGGWRYTDLHDFSSNEGTYPGGNIAIDNQGRIYGTCSSAGQDLYGTAWEFTP